MVNNTAIQTAFRTAKSNFFFFFTDGIFIFVNICYNGTRSGSRAVATSKIERFVIIALIKKRSILNVAAALDPSLTNKQGIHKIKNLKNTNTIYILRPKSSSLI